MIGLAFTIAVEAHQGQYRSGTRVPYVAHPLECALLLEAAGVEDPAVIQAAALHDVIEDTPMTYEDVEQLFGTRVASIVAEVTDPEGWTGKESKARQLMMAQTGRYSPEAVLVKLADKVSNITDLVRRPPAWRRESILGYARTCAGIVAALRKVESPEVARLARAFDAAYAAAMQFHGGQDA